MSTLLDALFNQSGGFAVSPVVFATDANRTVTADEYKNPVLYCTSTVALTATRTLFLPATSGATFFVQNSTTGGQAIVAQATSGAGVTIPAGDRQWVAFNGTDYVSSTGKLTVYDSFSASLGDVTQAQFFGLDAHTVGGRPRISPFVRYPRIAVRARATVNMGSGLAAYTVPANPTPVAPGYTTQVLTLSSAFVNSVALQQTDRVFLAGQSNAAENGLYEFVATGNLLYRLSALDDLTTTANGIHIHVTDGSNAGYFLWNASGIAVDEDRGLDYHRFDVDHFYLSTDATTSDGPDMLPAYKRAQDASAKNGVITFHRRERYFFNGPLDMVKGVRLEGNSVKGSTQNNAGTRFQFRGSTTGRGVRPLTNVPGYPTAGHSGNPQLYGITVENLDSNTASAGAHGLDSNGAIIVDNCGFFNWSGNGIQIVAHSAGQPSTVTVSCTFDGSFAGAAVNGLQLQVSGTGVTGQPAVIFKNSAVVASGAGTRDVTFASVLGGPYTAPAGSLTVLVSPPTGFLSATNVADATPGLYPGNANNSSLSRIQVRDNGKWGVYCTGDNVNACTFTSIDANNNAKRTVVGSDGKFDCGGIWDFGFIGNTWIQCHTTAHPSATSYAYRCDNDSSATVFIGCYQESGQVSRIKAPNMVLGGIITNESGSQLPGLTSANNGIILRGVEQHTGGSPSTAGLVRTDMPGGDSIMTLKCTDDTNNYFWNVVSSGSMNHTYAWQHLNSLARTAWGMTNVNHAYGPGTFIAYNGVLLGTSFKINGTVGGTPPATSQTTPGSPTINDGFWAVGHQFNDGKTWFGVQAKDGSNNLTWQFVSSRGAHTTLGSGAGSVTASPYTVSLKDHRIMVNVAGACTINLPAPATKYCVIVKDISGAAATNNITLHRSGSETIDGVAADLVLATNYGQIEVWSDGTNVWTDAPTWMVDA